MVKNNSSNNDYTDNADGGEIAGGIVSRALKWIGANITLTGSGSLIHTFPNVSGTLMSHETLYAFGAYASGTTTVNLNTFVKIAFATELYDYNNNFATSTYTAPINGVYHFDAAITHVSVSASPSDAFTTIYKNGAEIARGNRFPASTNATLTWGVSRDLLLAAGDTIEIYHRQSSGGAESADSGQAITYFNGHLVRAT